MESEEIVLFEPGWQPPGTADAIFPDGSPANLAAGCAIRREVFADWLVFRRTIPGSRGTSPTESGAGFWGRGIVQEADDVRAR